MRSDSFSVSGRECVAALSNLGFAIVRHAPGLTMLRKEAHIVLVPDTSELPLTVLDAILDDAHLSFAKLLQAIDEIPTDPELRTLDA